MNSHASSISDAIPAPPTEGIKYAGSKLKLLPYIMSLAKRTGAKTILDGFSGTTVYRKRLPKVVTESPATIFQFGLKRSRNVIS